jgi:hypothetical protein
MVVPRSLLKLIEVCLQGITLCAPLALHNLKVGILAVQLLNVLLILDDRFIDLFVALLKSCNLLL